MNIFKDDSLIRLAYFLLFTVFLIVVSVVSFQLVRYTPMPQGRDAYYYSIWDRWEHRICYILVDSKFNSAINGVACTFDDLNKQIKAIE